MGRSISDTRRANITLLLQSRAGGNRAELARLIGKDYNQVAQWFDSKDVNPSARNIGSKLARELEQILKLPENWFDADHDSPPSVAAYEIREWSDESEIAEGSDEVLIHEVEVSLSAGHGAAMPQFVETKRRLPFHTRFLARYGAKAQDCKLFPVKGDSMANVLFDGDTVLVHMKDKRVVEGEIYAIFNRVTEETQVKYLRMLTSGALEISSENPAYRAELVPEEEQDRVFIIGRAISRSGGLGKRGRL